MAPPLPLSPKMLTLKEEVLTKQEDTDYCYGLWGIAPLTLKHFDTEGGGTQSRSTYVLKNTTATCSSPGLPSRPARSSQPWSGAWVHFAEPEVHPRPG